MIQRIYLYIIFILLSQPLISQGFSRISREEYIEIYKDIAISEMIRSGIPASITLAQGMLESDNGNSTLARKGNNHFGIKCHSSWKGNKIFHDDDKKNECFRKYKSAEESYIDHTEFLMEGSRYAFLFELEKTDYKAWAKGLKKAGYATSSKYAHLLIKIIEDNELHQYDLAEDSTLLQKDRRHRKDKTEGRQILTNNRVKYIIVKEGDSFESLRDELELLNREIYRYNELSQDSVARPGQIIYLQPKRTKAEAGKRVHILQEGEDMYSVSQKYAIKLDHLLYRNGLEPGDQPEVGTEILLRKGKKPGLKFDFQKDPKEEEEEFEVEFEG